MEGAAGEGAHQFRTLKGALNPLDTLHPSIAVTKLGVLFTNAGDSEGRQGTVHEPEGDRDCRSVEAEEVGTPQAPPWPVVPASLTCPPGAHPQNFIISSTVSTSHAHCWLTLIPISVSSIIA